MREKEKHIIPEIKIIDVGAGLRRMGRFAVKCFGFLPTEPLSKGSDHFQNDRLSARAMLSKPEAKEVYEQLRIDFDSLDCIKTEPHNWRQYPDLASYEDEYWGVV